MRIPSGHICCRQCHFTAERMANDALWFSTECIHQRRGLAIGDRIGGACRSQNHRGHEGQRSRNANLKTLDKSTSVDANFFVTQIPWMRSAMGACGVSCPWDVYASRGRAITQTLALSDRRNRHLRGQHPVSDTVPTELEMAWIFFVTCQALFCALLRLVVDEGAGICEFMWTDPISAPVVGCSTSAAETCSRRIRASIPHRRRIVGLIWDSTLSDAPMSGTRPEEAPEQ